jgi:saccharopine dehydrogenase-like NADP-dependent oxidoreductase
MHEIIVLGGYGRVGRHCVSELVETTRARVVVAGRSIQRAEQVASVFGERARPAYANATDPRTLQPLIPGAVAVLTCCGPSTQAVLEIAVETRVPFIGLTGRQQATGNQTSKPGNSRSRSFATPARFPACPAWWPNC